MPPQATKSLFTFAATLIIAADSREEALARVMAELEPVVTSGMLQIALAPEPQCD